MIHDKTQEALKLALEAHLALREWINAVPNDTPLPAMPGIDGDWLDEVASTIREALAEQPAQPQVPTIYIYRQPDGSTHVMAPNIDAPLLVIDMLEEGIRAMTEGHPITRN